ncbi:hypothetical protein RND81_12G235100 [Saponaria officinalis]
MKILSHTNNQRWVHLPFSICDTFKCLGNEFSCLFPCKSSCFSSNHDKNINNNNNGNNSGGSSCGVVFRWMVSLHEENDERRNNVVIERNCSRRRSIFDDMEFDDLFNNNDNDNDNDDDKCGRVSICVPPKNALLLMRCRSDPKKMASLSKNEQNVVIKEINEVINEVDEIKVEEIEKKLEEKKVEEKLGFENRGKTEEIQKNEDFVKKFEILENGEKTQLIEIEEKVEGLKNEQKSCELLEDSEDLEQKNENEEKDVIVEIEGKKSIENEKNNKKLPDCLLLMMCEPKLSMEVSKETWVCNTDFVRWLPERHLSQKSKKIEGVDHDECSNGHKKTKAAAVAALPPLGRGGRLGIQPGRSSISFPMVGGSLANLIDKKMGDADPFVLTRCKSTPLRSTDTFVSPELGCL